MAKLSVNRTVICSLALRDILRNIVERGGNDIAAKKNERPDLEKIAAQLARVKITPVAGQDGIALKATATFTTKSFDAGKYKVAVGLTHAVLQLDHPSFDREHAYQATLAKDRWSESWKSRQGTKLAGEVKAGIGAKIAGYFSFGAKGEAAKESQESAEQKASVPYPIVGVTPTGWQIGTILGDPRAPVGTLPDGLESCLNGEYLSGRNDERGDGYKGKDGSLALCVLKPNHHGNDPRIVATLFGVSGSLKVAVTSVEPAIGTSSALQREGETKTQEEALRKAFIDICVQRATMEHAQTATMLSGEFYLSQHEIHAPKLPQQETRAKTKDDSNEQVAAIDPKN